MNRTLYQNVNFFSRLFLNSILTVFIFNLILILSTKMFDNSNNAIVYRGTFNLSNISLVMQLDKENFEGTKTFLFKIYNDFSKNSYTNSIAKLTDKNNYITVDKNTNITNLRIIEKTETKKEETNNKSITKKIIKNTNETKNSKNLITISINNSKYQKTIRKIFSADSEEQIKIDGRIYKVKKGDSLWKIARKFGIRLAALVAVNLHKLENLDSALALKPGDKLIIPSKNFEKNLNLENFDLWKKLLNKTRNRTKNKKIKKRFFAKPLSRCIVTSPFGWRYHPIYHTKLFHSGVDFRAKIGTPVKASADGRVIFAGWLRGYGRVIVIKHKKGFETRYAHLSKIKVRRGQYVKQGQIIALSGNSGISTGPHLHFEIRKYGIPQNPLKYIRR